MIKGVSKQKFQAGMRRGHGAKKRKVIKAARRGLKLRQRK